MSFGYLSLGFGTVGPVATLGRGVFMGGYNQNTMRYITIDTTGNSTDFGDLLFAAKDLASGGASDGTRGLAAGDLRTTSNIDVIQYITLATTGDATEFGNLNPGRSVAAAASNVQDIQTGSGDGGIGQ